MIENDKKKIDLLKSILFKKKIINKNDEIDIKSLSSLNYYIDEVIADELMEFGFTYDGDINKYGLELEELIDFFNKIRFLLQEKKGTKKRGQAPFSNSNVEEEKK